MTHLIIIGEGYEDSSDSEVTYWDIHTVENEDAPKSSGISGKTNRRDHASSYFHQMVRETKMGNWWSQANQWGNLYGHKELTEEDLKIFKTQYNNAANIDEFYTLHEKFDEEDVVEWFDFMIYWIDFALKSTQKPMIVIR